MHLAPEPRLPRFSSVLLLAVFAAAGSVSTDVLAQTACSVKGSPVIAKTADLYSAVSGGEVLARYTGQPVAMSITVPASGVDRASVKIGASTSAFRLEGFTEISAIPGHTTKNVPIAGQTVSIGAGRQVKLAPSTAGQIAVSMTVSAPIEQSVKANAACDAITLDIPTITQPGPPGNARGYVAKKSPLDIRSSAGGDVVFTFSSSSIVDALLFWSTEQQNGYVHVLLTGDLVVDGWAAMGDLKVLPKGEMLGAMTSTTSSYSAPKLMMSNAPQTAKANKDSTIKRLAKDDATSIGTLESGAEVYVLETILGWSNVLPLALNLQHPDNGGGFWVKAADLTATTK